MTKFLFTAFLSTGFVFSEAERSALEQFEGGPCAVIAPVQVFTFPSSLIISINIL